MFGSFLITLREGLEAALIIGIMLAILVKTNSGRGSRAVWFGTTAAILLSFVVGGMIFLFAGDFGDPGEAIFEGITLITAVGVLTWMIFWMRKQSGDLKNSLQTQVKTALSRGSMLGLALIAFFAVFREGIETILFLFAVNSASESPVLFLIGGFAGLAVAIGIGYAIYKNSSKLNLKTFFTVTGLFLIIFAAGLLAQGVHELNEVKWIPAIIEHTWDTNSWLPESSTLGTFLKTLFGYNGNPSLAEVTAYLVYLVPTLFFYLRSAKNSSKPSNQLRMIEKSLSS